ncbi:AUGMIN subunit 4-like [Cucurbita maxima]|uniref:AUGMIN subunit 4-like n=1 Tax=Cucurbita maxima TaxID=3661 RepID=A0A6J1IMP1_CUCMA|nr:AUGMIN subunit 4-like [Cucurbita maxima]XP_022976603.1 AUGMIN subunit 4-like [Cucurbita maxima]
MDLLSLRPPTIYNWREKKQAVSMAYLGGVRDVQALHPQLGFKNSPFYSTEIERQELHSADRKLAENYNFLKQILGVLIKLVKDLKLQHQHKYDDFQKTGLCKRCVKYPIGLREVRSIQYKGVKTFPTRRNLKP